MQNERKVYIGLDFGTKNTKIAFIFENKDEPSLLDMKGISNSKGYIESLIAEKDNKIHIGEKVKELYENDKSIKIYYGFKMKMFEDEKNKEYTIKFLRKIRKEIENEFKDKIISYKFSIPYSYLQTKPEKYRDILKEAGFKIPEDNKEQFFIAEPFASAYYFSKKIDKKAYEGKKVLAIDAGAGTIDFVVVEIKDKIEEIKDSSDYYNFGGLEIDKKLLEKLGIKENLDALRKIEEARIKINKINRIEFEYNGEKYILTRNIIEETLEDWSKKIENRIKNLYEKYKFDYIVVSGGLSSFYLLKKIIEDVSKELGIKELPILNIDDEDKYFKSIAFGVAIISKDGLEIKETLKQDICIEFEYALWGQIKEIYISNDKAEFKFNEKTNKVRLTIFKNDEFIGNSKKISEIKYIDTENQTFDLKLKSWGSIDIIIISRDGKEEKRTKNLKNLGDIEYAEISVDKNRIIKLRYKISGKEELDEIDFGKI